MKNNNGKKEITVSLVLNELVSFLCVQASFRIVDIMISAKTNGEKDLGVGFSLRHMENMETLFTDAIDVVILNSEEECVIASIPVIAKDEDEVKKLCELIAQSVGEGVEKISSEISGLHTKMSHHTDIEEGIEKLKKSREESKKESSSKGKVIDLTGRNSDYDGRVLH